MADILETEKNIKAMVKKLKDICQARGFSNSAKEENIVTTVFLYKFLNDKFWYDLNAFAKKINADAKTILENKEILNVFYDSYPDDVRFEYEDTIEYLVNKKNSNDFGVLFDETLLNISNKNKDFSIKLADGTDNKTNNAFDERKSDDSELFQKLSDITNLSKADENNFVVEIFDQISSERFDFSSLFDDGFDFFSALFEYVIKDYNVASGEYAEYYTPQVIAEIISEIVISFIKIEDKLYRIYDPAAGSGMLILHTSHKLEKRDMAKVQVYTQDISDKSTRFLRFNMLLNGLKSNLEYIVRGNTLTGPAFYKIPGDESSGQEQFDIIVSNPPFKLDFSNWLEYMQKWNEAEVHDGLTRFFAGIPKEPAKNKNKMPVYLCFIQHILWSLKDDGKAAIVVPTGFLTAQSGIERKIREIIINRKWLKGVISMPPNIFANTGTNVSVIFIDKANEDDDVMLIDASKLGEKKKDGKNQRAVLNEEEKRLIVDTFVKKNVIEDFSVLVSFKQIAGKNYSLIAGQYFEIKIEYVNRTEEELKNMMHEHTEKLNIFFKTNNALENEIKERINKVLI